MKSFEITALNENDWQKYKAIRLRSLKESPDSFGSTYHRELGFSDDQWKSRLKKTPEKIDSLIWLAETGKSSVGLVSGVLFVREPNHANLFQMWVDPLHREIGIGTELFNRVKAWAVDRGATSIKLSVATNNPSALAAYKKGGFQAAGKIEPLRTDSDISAQPMELNLNTSYT